MNECIPDSLFQGQGRMNVRVRERHITDSRYQIDPLWYWKPIIPDHGTSFHLQRVNFIVPTRSLRSTVPHSRFIPTVTKTVSSNFVAFANMRWQKTENESFCLQNAHLIKPNNHQRDVVCDFVHIRMYAYMRTKLGHFVHLVRCLQSIAIDNCVAFVAGGLCNLGRITVY